MVSVQALEVMGIHEGQQCKLTLFIGADFINYLCRQLIPLSRKICLAKCS